jgi:hypothetical protein
VLVAALQVSRFFVIEPGHNREVIGGAFEAVAVELAGTVRGVGEVRVRWMTFPVSVLRTLIISG